MITRRHLVLAAALASAGGAHRSFAQSAANQWFPVTGDDGSPVPNMRVPIELTEDVEDLPGAIWGGSSTPAVTLVEFYDYNCPWCRAAAKELKSLMAANADLRVGLVNNPILSPASAQAAKVQLAVLKLKGAAPAQALTSALYGAPGRIDGSRALDAAAKLGLERREVEKVADGVEVNAVLGRQMRLAASIGLVATPSYVVAGAAVLGFPGPKALGTIVADARSCGTISC